MDVTTQGRTTNSTGTLTGLPVASSADTITVSRYTRGVSAVGTSEMTRVAGAVPRVGLKASHGAPTASRAFQESVPCAALVTKIIAVAGAMLPTAAESSSWEGATAKAGNGGGGLLSRSTWQVASRMTDAIALSARAR